MVNPDRLRVGIDEFIDKAFLTDACLLFAPSQLALAAVLNAASKEQENLDSYVTGSLFHDARDQLKDLVDAVKSKLNMPKVANGSWSSGELLLILSSQQKYG